VSRGARRDRSGARTHARGAFREARLDRDLHGTLLGLFIERPAIVRCADVVFDSAVTPLAPGLRGARLTTDRQIVFSSGGVEVLLHVGTRAPGELHDLVGQVLADGDGFAVHLLREGHEVALVSCDDLGEFAVLGLYPGEYEVVIAGAGLDLHLGSLVVP
jgi:hypothetical protein